MLQCTWSPYRAVDESIMGSGRKRMLLLLLLAGADLPGYVARVYNSALIGLSTTGDAPPLRFLDRANAPSPSLFANLQNLQYT